jgi:hypothetical protein
MTKHTKKPIQSHNVQNVNKTEYKITKTTKNIHVTQHDKKTLKTTSKSHIRIHTHKLMLNITTTSQVHKLIPSHRKKKV